MAPDAEQRRPYRQPVHREKQNLASYDQVDKTSQELFGGDGMLFHQLRQVVQSRRYGKSEEAKAEKQADVADDRKNPHR